MSHVSGCANDAGMACDQHHDQEVVSRWTNGTLTVQMVCAATVVVLTILGLVHFRPLDMAVIATIAVSASLALQGLIATGCYSQIVNCDCDKPILNEIRTGLTAEFVAGVVGLILGFMSLVGGDADFLIGVAVISLGTGLLFGAGIHNRLSHCSGGNPYIRPFLRRVNSDLVAAAAGTEVTVAAGAIVLGILAMASPASHMLFLIALLALGSSTLITSAAMAGKMGGIWARD